MVLSLESIIGDMPILSLILSELEILPPTLMVDFLPDLPSLKFFLKPAAAFFIYLPSRSASRYALCSMRQSSLNSGMHQIELFSPPCQIFEVDDLMELWDACDRETSVFVWLEPALGFF